MTANITLLTCTRSGYWVLYCTGGDNGDSKLLSLLSDSDSGRHTDARLRKIFQNLRKILAFERKTLKLASFNMI